MMPRMMSFPARCDWLDLARTSVIVPAVAIGTLIAGAACRSGQELSGTFPVPSPAASAPAGSSVPAATTATERPTPAAAVPPGAAATAATAVASGPAATPPEVPPEGISRNAWARDRIAAVVAIWGFSEDGQRWLESYDLRQMYGQPAWFGSYGHDNWAGAGEAIPRVIVHELSHSYWGEFHVEGLPDLSWEKDQDGVAPAMAQYRRDLETFMSQPPDRFEPLRDRFRNMPDLFNGEYPDLYHFGEADIVHFTGGDLDLVPPILRKYYSSYLTPAGVAGDDIRDWGAAIAWWRGLNDHDRDAAGDVFGLQHFPLERYRVPARPGARLTEKAGETLAREQRQRLSDFAGQFELIKSREFALVDAAGVNRGFSFWRNYLSEMKGLHRAQPGVLRDHSSALARNLGAALDFYIGVERLSPASQAERYRLRATEPAVREMAVLLKARAIVDLFGTSQAPPLPGGPGGGSQSGPEAAIGHYAAKLAVTAARVDAVLSAGRQGPEKGAAELEAYLASLSDSELRSDVGLIFDLLRDADPDLTGQVLPALRDDVLLRLLSVQPSAARAGEIGPTRLLRAAGVVRGAGVETLLRGAATLAEHSSGNFAIDLPYELAVFDVIEALGRADPAGALRVISGSGMRIDPWIERGSTEMLSIFDRARPEAAMLISGFNGPRTSPQRIIHSLAALDPGLAADLLTRAASRTGGDLGARGLLEFTYDAYWRGAGGGVAVEPALTGRFMAALAIINGDNWLRSGYDHAVALMRRWAATGETEPGSEAELRRTLSEAARASGPAAADLIGRLLSPR